MHPLVLAASALLFPALAWAQGSLTPPGAPAPLGRTLTQLEPRIDVATLAGDATAVHVITAPGSYYLSANITVPASLSGVAVAAANVTLDLNGFAITGQASSVRGVELRNTTGGLVVHGGHVTNTGGAGIGASGAGPSNVHLYDLGLRSCAGGGIVLPVLSGVVVENCRVNGCLVTGIDLTSQGTVRNCAVDSNSSNSVSQTFAIRAGVVSHCRVNLFSNSGGPAAGIVAGEVSHCSVTSLNGGGGSSAAIAATSVSHCQVLNVNNASGTIFGISSSGRVVDCTVSQIGSASNGPGAPIGISAGSASGCRVNAIGNAASTGDSVGISALAGRVHDCTVSAVAGGAGLNVNGITAAAISHCTLEGATGSSSLVGFNATRIVDHCTVHDLVQTGGTASAIGISARRINDSTVSNLTGLGTNSTIAFDAYLLASGCTATAVTQTAGSLAICFEPDTGGETVQCVVNNTSGIGVNAVTGANTVRSCRITLGGSGTGIATLGTRHRFEDNTISNCTNGINASTAGTSGFIARNRVTDCANDILSLAAWQIGPILSATDPVDTTSPWANFTD